MSFITKRERVFNEYDLFDLPARNEGKLKAYASCTDARAWSHFCSDQTEHLVDIIKRNNETCRTKYVPTDVIVNTLMVAKNAEIGRLKRKIEEFEQMLAAYDQLDLTSEQKIEIANAHAAIKAANKELDELYLDLDLSGFTEGIDSEAFETGKSRGDEIDKLRTDESEKYRGDEHGKYRGDDSEKYPADDWIYEKQQIPLTSDKCNQIKLSNPCDASTNIHDPRIQQMQDTIISKDAKLNAMQNTIAVMENDVCEPYCIYAHIYTALEKIFGILCQNDKYKLYLNLMTEGNDIRCVDIKGKILFKLKVLEKFSLALIAPCSQETPTRPPNCSCYRAEISQHVKSTLALTCSESKQPCLDNKRAHLVADIMENDEMKEILSKESSSDNICDDQSKDNFNIENYDIDTENLRRLKSLQTNYDDLVTCYENLKHDKDNLNLKCQKYKELENEYEILRAQLREYNLLWNEKEHYRKRSEDLDALKEKFLILTDETTNLETQLKAESEINHIKTNTIEDLRNENISLNKKLNDTIIAFEKEKNLSQCKLKEMECKMMCQEQQIKSMSVQIDRLLEQDKIQVQEDPAHSILLINEIESLKDEIKNLNNALFCNEEEKLTLQDKFEEKLKDINELKMAVEDWKSIYEKIQQRNNYLENYAQSYEDELHTRIEENRILSQELEDKKIDVYKKSQEIENLIDEIKSIKNKNDSLLRNLSDVQNIFERNIASVENEKIQALQSLDLARRDSDELLNKVKDYDGIIQKQDVILKSYEAQIKGYDELKNVFLSTVEENRNLQVDIKNRENNYSILLKEIQRLREMQTNHDTNIFHDDGKQYQTASLELTKKESEILENFENLSQQLHSARSSHEKLNHEKKELEMEYELKMRELADTNHSAQAAKKKLLEVDTAYTNIINDNQVLQNQLSEKNKELNNLKEENNSLFKHCNQLASIEQDLKVLQKAYEELITEKKICKHNLDNKMNEITNLNNILENKNEENVELIHQIKCLENDKRVIESKLISLQNKNLVVQISLDGIKTENSNLIDKVKQYEIIEKDLEVLRRAYNQLKIDKENVQAELDMRLTELRKIGLENKTLHRDSQTLLRHSENLEKLITKPDSSHSPYTTIKKEIENMKEEKLDNQRRIKELSDKLDDSDNIITNLSEDIVTRDVKIAILENHINELEDEVRRLHETLAQAVNTGEEVQQYSYEIDQSLKNIEAHHSRATHNMKMDLIKLQNEKSILEDRLSTTKLKTEESATEKDKYVSQIAQLQNEIEIIVTNIKQLEFETVGSSNLYPKNCTIEEILMSLDRIHKILDGKNSKCNLLEQKLLKVQTSSQLLVSEAKGIVEKEKQKILIEKEEIIRDKLNMQKQLEDQKAHLEKQILQDKIFIKDLEGEILNQKLIFDKINKSTQNYVSKLNDDLHALQNLYENSIVKVNELQEKLLHSSEETTQLRAIVEKSKFDLEQKSKEITKLLNDLEEFRNKPRINVGIQVSLSNIKTNTSIQTDKDLKDSEHIISFHINENNLRHKEKVSNLADNPLHDLNISSMLSKQKPNSVNEVQILTANVEPSFDFVRNSYLKYKLKQLRPGRLEQYSILNDDDENSGGQFIGPAIFKKENIFKYTQNKNPHLIDIYNRQYLDSNSSKAIYKNTLIDHDQQSPTKSSLFTGSNLTNDSFVTDISINKYKPSSSSEKATDKDFFIIYRDNEPNYLDEQRNVEEFCDINENSHKKTNYKNGNEEVKYKEQSDIGYENECEEENIDNEKLKLHINVPRVVTDSLSLGTSESDKKSLDSYTMNLYPLGNQIATSDLNVNKNNSPSLLAILNNENKNKYISKSLKTTSRENEIDDSRVQIKRSLDLNTHEIKLFTNKKNELSEEEKISDIESPDYKSHHKLSQVDADIFVTNPDDEISYKANYTPNYSIKSPQNFALQYILNSVYQKLDTEVNATKFIRKTHSDVRFNQQKTQHYDTSTTASPSLKLSSLEYKTDINYIHSPSKAYEKTQLKSVVERSVMAKIDNTQEYESKIKHMSMILENIEKDYKNKMQIIKMQYDNNIKGIINEHNDGVKNMQNLHEETLQDILKAHENEVENLRTLAMEAMRKSDKLEKENRSLKSYFNDEPSKVLTTNLKKGKKCRIDATLTKTNVEAFNVKPKSRSLGPCTCSLDVNISDTIRNIFDQVDVEQRKMAEHTYMKYIVEKIVARNVEALDTHELSFLHLKVCRTWKMKLNKEEAVRRRDAHRHITELDHQVAELRRSKEEAVCSSATEADIINPDPVLRPGARSTAKVDLLCNCDTALSLHLGERQSAGDPLQPVLSAEGVRPRRVRIETNKAVLTRPNEEERREKRLYVDDPPTRLRRGHGTGSERANIRTLKK